MIPMRNYSCWLSQYHVSRLPALDTQLLEIIGSRVHLALIVGSQSAQKLVAERPTEGKWAARRR